MANIEMGANTVGIYANSNSKRINEKSGLIIDGNNM